jgi:predicted nucleic-acid-binding Zn-ribbon protein
MEDTLKCSKCNSDMVEGAVVYRTSQEVKTAFGGSAQIDVEAEWVSNHSTGPRGRRDAFSVRTFNCPKCGYLESYAP